MLDKIVRDYRDEDKHTVVGMAIIASAGREARETLVWTVVGRWGVMWPPGKDEYGKVIPSKGRNFRIKVGLAYRFSSSSCSTLLDTFTPRRPIS